jgi:hypothetical protein
MINFSNKEYFMKLSVLLLASAISGFAFAETTTNSTTATPYAPTDSSSSWNSSNSLNSPTMDSRTGSATSSPSATSPSDTSTSPTADSNMNSAATTDASTETTSRTFREETLAPRAAWGGFYVEPGIFGSRNDTDLKTSQLLPGSDVNGTSDGVGLDLKLGGHVNDIVFLAVDGRYERSRMSGSSYSNADSNVYNWGPTLGFQAPVWGLRLWGTYVVDGINDPESGAQNVDFRFKDPYGWRGGIGFHIQNVSLNLEYEDLTYRTTEIQSVGNAPAGANTNVDFGQRGYLASLSFPISL